MIGSDFILLDEVDSTNNCLRSLLSNKKIHDGFTIAANYQTLGRGQSSNHWYSSKAKNILLSFVVFPENFAAENQFDLNICFSLAVNDFIAAYIKDGTAIKWSNDIFIHDRKVAGMLIENSIQGRYINSCICGLGININEELFPESIPNPTSLFNELNKSFELKDLYEKLFHCLNKRYSEMKAGKTTEQNTEYISKLFRYNVLSVYESDGEIFEGKISGIDASGKLKILTAEGEKVFANKEVRFVR